MKFLRIFFVFALIFKSSWAEEITNVSIITPTPYVLTDSSTQNVKSKITVSIGDLINKDVVEAVKSKTEPFKKDLLEYFPRSGELDSFIDQVTREGRDTVIAGDLSDDHLILFYGFLGNKLIGGFADKIMEKQGIKDPERRAIWLNKIMTPFNSCINRSANALYNAEYCLTALSSSLVPSLGLGLVYELTRANLNSSLPENQREAFNAGQALAYKTCIAETTMSAVNVKFCALKVMKTGILKITETELSKKINDAATSSKNAEQIKQTIWRTYTGCISKVGNDTGTKTSLSDQFLNCIDHLVRDTGTQLVKEKISHTPAITDNFTSHEITDLASENMRAFKDCIDRLKDQNTRKNGMLDTDQCERPITNNITYKVVSKILKKSSNDSFKTDPKLALSLSTEGIRSLDKCWDMKQSTRERENCLKKTILSFAQIIAQAKLEQAIPSDLSNRSNLLTDSLTQLGTCLNKQLTSNISNDSNLQKKINSCSGKLTLDIAQKVAQELIRSKALENKMPLSNIDSLIKTQVDQNFVTCLGKSPTEEKLSSCGSELKKNVSIAIASFQIYKNAEGKIPKEEANSLVDSIVTLHFSTCLGIQPKDEKINECIVALTKEATKSLVIASEKKQLKDMLNADSTPSMLKANETSFVSCIDNTTATNLSPQVDECIKQFALGFAKNLGELKMTNLMKSLLGTTDYNLHHSSIDAILNKYNQCLNDLKPLSLQEGFLEKLSICTDELQQKGTFFVTSTFNSLMSSEEKDAATLLIKNEFANLLPCLSSLMPTSPYTETQQSNIDSLLKPVALILAQYIDYSPENAKKTLNDIVAQLSKDLKETSDSEESKRNILDLLYKNGALDQFLKAMVRGQIKQALSEIPDTDLSQELRQSILSKATYDSIFATEDGKLVKDMLMDKILKPVLLQQTDMKSPEIKAGMDAIKDKIVRMLVNSPKFGEQIIKTSIQYKMSDLNGVTRFFAKTLYGKSSLNWEKVRLSDKGMAAELYIRDNFLYPKFKGQVFTKAEEKRIMTEAENLVKKAVKNYD